MLIDTRSPTVYESLYQRFGTVLTTKPPEACSIHFELLTPPWVLRMVMILEFCEVKIPLYRYRSTFLHNDCQIAPSPVTVTLACSGIDDSIYIQTTNPEKVSKKSNHLIVSIPLKIEVFPFFPVFGSWHPSRTD